MTYITRTDPYTHLFCGHLRTLRTDRACLVHGTVRTEWTNTMHKIRKQVAQKKQKLNVKSNFVIE